MSGPSRAEHKRQALRAIASSLLLVGLLVAGIARLARVRRPSIRDAIGIVDTRFELARVVLARPGESDGETLGWTVRCRSGTRREIVALPGRTRPSVSVGERGSLTVVRGDFRREITDASCQ